MAKKKKSPKKSPVKPIPMDVEFPSAFALFRLSFSAVMLNVWTFFGLLCVPLGYLIVDSLFFKADRLANPRAPLGGVETAVLVIGVLATLLVGPALPYVQLQSAKGKEVSLGKALAVGFKRFWGYYHLLLMIALMVVGGFLLLVVPGVFMIKRYILAPYYFYDKEVGAREAMRLSRADSAQFSGAVWGLLGVALLISLPGVIRELALVVAGLQVVYYCAPAFRYLQIKKAKKG